jgi:hypothetical protein
MLQPALSERNALVLCTEISETLELEIRAVNRVVYWEQSAVKSSLNATSLPAVPRPSTRTLILGLNTTFSGFIFLLMP